MRHSETKYPTGLEGMEPFGDVADDSGFGPRRPAASLPSSDAAKLAKEDCTLLFLPCNMHQLLMLLICYDICIKQIRRCPKRDPQIWVQLLSSSAESVKGAASRPTMSKFHKKWKWHVQVLINLTTTGTAQRLRTWWTWAGRWRLAWRHGWHWWHGWHGCWWHWCRWHWWRNWHWSLWLRRQEIARSRRPSCKLYQNSASVRICKDVLSPATIGGGFPRNNSQHDNEYNFNDIHW